MNGAGCFQHFECLVPELQMQDFTLAGQQIVMNVQARHGVQMAGNDGVRYHLRNFSVFSAIFFDGF